MNHEVPGGSQSRVESVPSAPVRIPSLDGLRGLLLLLVLQAHLAMSHFLPPWLRASPLGFAALTCFFVISGYLITRQLMKEQDKHGSVSLKSFYIKRAFRIFPVFLVYALSLLALRAAGVVHVSNYEFFRASTFTMNYLDPPHRILEHLWSLSVEEQFYLIWPLLLVALTRRKAIYVCAAVVILCPMFRALAWDLNVNRTLIPRRFELIADCLAFGCLLALCEASLRRSTLFRRVITDLGASLACCAMLATVLIERFRPETMIVGRTIVSCGAAIVIMWLMNNPDRGFGILVNHPIPVFLGQISYSVYMWQQLFCMPTPGEPILLRFPANIVATFLVGIPTYLLVETKMIAVGRQVAFRFKSR
ncbi:MAG: acyltransferase [Bryobacteraceae bacterium]